MQVAPLAAIEAARAVSAEPLRQQLAQAVKRPQRQRAVYAWVVAAEAAGQHSQVLLAREIVAVALHRHLDLPVTTIANLLDGGQSVTKALAELVEAAPVPPEAAANRDWLLELHDTARQLHEVRAGAKAAGEKFAPLDGPGKVPSAVGAQPSAEVVRQLHARIETSIDTATARRNSAAAGLVLHRAWPTSAAARIAGASWNAISRAPAADDDGGLVDVLLGARDEVARLEVQEGELRDWLGRASGAQPLPRARVDLDALRAERADLDDIADSDARILAAANLAGRIRAARRQMVTRRDAAAAALFQQYEMTKDNPDGWSKARLTSILIPGSRGQSLVNRILADAKPMAAVKETTVARALTESTTLAAELLRLAEEVEQVRKAAEPTDVRKGRRWDGVAVPDAKELGLPEDPAAQRAAIRIRLAELKPNLAAALAARDAVVIGLVVHHGWSKQSARLAARISTNALVELVRNSTPAPAAESTPQRLADLVQQIAELTSERRGLNTVLKELRVSAGQTAPDLDGEPFERVHRALAHCPDHVGLREVVYKVFTRDGLIAATGLTDEQVAEALLTLKNKRVLSKFEREHLNDTTVASTIGSVMHRPADMRFYALVKPVPSS